MNVNPPDGWGTPPPAVSETVWGEYGFLKGVSIAHERFIFPGKNFQKIRINTQTRNFFGARKY